MIYDVAVIGAGVSGAMIARELSKYNLKIALFEKANDVAMGASKANSGIVHAGFDAVPGSLKAKLNVDGCALMPQTCKDLSVPYKNNGSLVVAFSDKEMKTVWELYYRGIANKVPGMEIIDKTELQIMEPNISDEAVGALLAKTAGIVCPYELTIAAAEVACENGVELFRNCRVAGTETTDDCVIMTTTVGKFKAKYIINATGVHSGHVAQRAGDNSINIIARKGEYYLLDKSVGNLVSKTIFQCPSDMGKGILVAPTVDGNLIIGPTAADIPDEDDTSTSLEGLKEVRTLATKSIPSVSTRYAITSFAGLRAHDASTDFVIGQSKSNPRLINVAGIESPGLSAAPATAKYIEDIILKLFPGVTLKEHYNLKRKPPVRFRHMTDEQRAEIIKENPKYGNIICRCETITEGEIVDAIKGPVGAMDVDGVKRRTRAGMGRCQGGFCGSKVVEILARELGCDVDEITKFGRTSRILFNKTK